MKHTLIACAFALLTLPVAATAAESVPYKTDMTTWQIVKGPDATGQWSVNNTAAISFWFKDSGYTAALQINSSSTEDCWAISPAVHLEAGKKYSTSILRYMTATGAHCNLEMRYAAAATTSALTSGPQIACYQGDKMSGYHSMGNTISVAQTGDYYFGIHIFGTDNNGWLRVTGFEIEEFDFSPAAPGAFEVTPGDDHALSTALTWTLPTTDSKGAPFPDGVAIQNVKVYRDGALAATLDATATSWTDNASTGLKPGFHEYGVEVTVQDIVSPRLTKPAGWVGPYSALDLPWDFSTSPLTKTDFDYVFRTAKGPEAGGNFVWTIHALKNPDNTMVNYISFNAVNYIQDDWMITPKVKVPKPGVYRFTMNLQHVQYPAMLKIYAANDTAVAAMTHQIGEIDQIVAEPTDFSFTFRADAAGEYAIGVRAYGIGSGDTEYCVRHLKIEEWHSTPANVEALAAAKDGNAIKITWKNPAVDNTGAPLTALTKVEVYRDGTLLGNAAVTQPGAEASFTDNSPVALGSSCYKVVPMLGEYAPEQTVPTVQGPWMGERLQTLPFTTDFTDAARNMLFTWRDADNDSPAWKVTTDGAVLNLQGTDSKPTDDQLFTPPFELTPGKYDVKLNMEGGAKDYELKVGYAADDAKAEVKGQQTLPMQYFFFPRDYATTLDVAEGGRTMFVINADDPAGGIFDLIIHKIEISKNTSVGIESVAEENSPAEYYTLSGIRIGTDMPRAKGIYLERQGTHSRKIVIR